ncbi:MAG TPA: phosphate regulon sensor histidine kinase PhoR [Burkholderiaceae bacterium]|nr:phosphate regulon sensor histidine kinase PhoR [Burkholderiaceae bacterium]
MSSTWMAVAARVALIAAVGMALGALFGRPATMAAVALALILAREFQQLLRLQRWLRTDRLDEAPDAGGVWGDVVGMIARLHRRKQYHKRRLLRLLRELRRSTAAIPDGVVLLNPQAEILWFNRMAARLLTLRSRTDVGLRIDNLVRQPEFVRYLAAGVFAQPVVLRSGTSGERFLQLHIVRYGAGQLLLLVRDVTRQEQLETMRKEFVANASHELRSPLTVIAGYLEMLANEPALDPAVAGPLQEMRRQATRMTGIIEDLLALSRLEADEGPVEGVDVDVAHLLEQLRRDAQAGSSPAPDVQLQVESASRLRADPALVQSAFANLLDNAAKYSPPGGTITVRWWTDAAGAHLAVQDHGIGIAAEHLPRLTERFYRVDAGRSRATGGSGLGLAIVKHVLQRHGGSLEIVSAEGQGSTFTCHFPPERVHAAAAAA